jgi:hypothetical protein
MGWRGTLRSLAATSRRIEREQQRKRRDLLKQQVQIERLGALQQAALEVSTYDNYLDLITSVHRDCGDTWNWRAVENAQPPVRPEYANQLEVTQRSREQQNQPGFFDRLLGRADAKRSASERAIEQAKAADQSRYASALQEYESKLEDWRTLKRIAAGVLAGDVPAFKEALLELNPFKEIKELARTVELSFNDCYAQATISLHEQEEIPTEIKTLLKSGKVSIKPAPATLINQTYQKHVCSCVLRASRELFAVLPFPKTFIHATTELLNLQTGNKELSVIVSALIPRETYETLDFAHLEPVDCMNNFVHRMKFSKTRGFSPVEKLNPRDFEAGSLPEAQAN